LDGNEHAVAYFVQDMIENYVWEELIWSKSELLLSRFLTANWIITRVTRPID